MTRYPHIYSSPKWHQDNIRLFVVLSVALHVAIFGGGYRFFAFWSARVIPEAITIQLYQGTGEGVGAPSKGSERVPQKPVAPPKPEPPKPEPPKPVEPPKPEPPKPEPPKPKPVEPPKPEPPKLKPAEKPQPKPAPVKPAEKPAPRTPVKVAERPQPSAAAATARPEPQNAAFGTKDGDPLSKMRTAGGQGIPSELSFWGRQVVRKVDDAWIYPEGVSLENNVATIMFTVDRNGNLVGEPVVVQEASDPRVAQSGLQAVKQAAPFPAVPETFKEPQVQILYDFTLTPG